MLIEFMSVVLIDWTQWTRDVFLLVIDRHCACLMFPIGLSGLDCCTGLNLCFAYLLIYLEGFGFWWGRLKMTSFPTVKRTPFGLAMIRLPDHILQPLLAWDILPPPPVVNFFFRCH